MIVRRVTEGKDNWRQRMQLIFPHFSERRTTNDERRAIIMTKWCGWFICFTLIDIDWCDPMWFAPIRDACAFDKPSAGAATISRDTTASTLSICSLRIWSKLRSLLSHLSCLVLIWHWSKSVINVTCRYIFVHDAVPFSVWLISSLVHI